MNRRKRLGPGRKALERGSTFDSRGSGLGRGRIGKREERELLRNNPKPRRESRRAPGATGWTQRVFKLYGRRCVVCKGRAAQGHHAVPRQVIVAREGEGSPLEYDARNGVPVCVDCHLAHETSAVGRNAATGELYSRRIRYERLPQGVIDWADDHGFAWYLAKVDVYPRNERAR